MNDEIFLNEEEEEFSPIARLIELGKQKQFVTLDDILHILISPGRDNYAEFHN